MQRANGSLDISFSKNEISKVHFTTPLRVFNNDDGNNDILSATIVNTSGGIVSGDNHKINVNICNNTKAQIFSNSAEKIYKSLSNNKSTIDNDIKIGKNSWFEWLPQETILFEDSKLERNLNIFLSENAESLVGEIVVLGRLAKGEYIDNVFFKDSISIYRNSKLEWLDKVLFNGKKILIFDENEEKTLKYIIDKNKKNGVGTDELFDIIENGSQSFDNKRKRLSIILNNINLKLRAITNIPEDMIQSIPSKEDNRLRNYRLNKKLFEK